MNRYVCAVLFCVGTGSTAGAQPSKLGSESEPVVIDDETHGKKPNNKKPNSDVSQHAQPLRKPDRADVVTDTVSIIGAPEKLPRTVGSAHVVTKQQLERYEYDDVHRVLGKIPGVYVRGEDGFGLRPNIGLRGANSDRSAKVTLMEDGILLGPAPYSAPAAYYFPLTTRLASMEVFKGPAAIKYGPNTIGGAINLVTHAIPSGSDRARTIADVDLAAGMYGFGKAHGRWGIGGKRFGVLVEGAHIQSSGFKQLDGERGAGGDDTGFRKSEFMLKGRWNSDANAAIFQQLEVKLGFALERSHETYLGISQEDFERAPRRRYAASQLGLMDWWRTQLQASYLLASDGLEVQLTAYRHDFSRDWRKLNRFRDATPLQSVLANPSGQSAVLRAILAGEADSSSPAHALLVGNNGRRFVSQGINAAGAWQVPRFLSWMRQSLSFGARFHFDQIERDHTEDGFLMQSGVLVPEGSESQTALKNFGNTRAAAFYLHDEIRLFDALTVSPGLRVEVIHTRFRDRLADDSQITNTDVVVIPGVGVHYPLFDWIGVLAGVHRGFSPVSPGQPDEVEPEMSVNYEWGARLGFRDTKAELIGYFNDYTNLTGECTLSTGCDERLLNAQFNGGAVSVYGLEAQLSQGWKGPKGIAAYGMLNYTLTLSDFRTSFNSANPQFGSVRQGDRLAYVPIHQLALMAGISWRGASLDASLTVVGEMRDVAGQGEIADSERIPTQAIVDLALGYRFAWGMHAYARIDNLFNNSAILSRRPFGIRPVRPLQALAGLKYHFGGAN